MVKVIVLLARREGMDAEAFARHMRETHLPLVAALPGLRRLIFNLVLPNPDPNAPPAAYDAVSEDWFDDPAAMAAAFASPTGQALLADSQNVLDLSRVQWLIVEEDEIPVGA
jgi:uncharacterized protein (TIGR02118 family)